MAARLVHFEIHAQNPERAAAFYKAVFNWTFSKWDGPADYWLICTGPDSEPGINGGMVLRRGPDPIDGQAVNAFVCTAHVESLDDTLSLALSKGATIAVPKMPIPFVGWLAYIKDTEGNIFGLMQPDSNAK